MLISHSAKFIYLKTLKTASTSVEIYFEPYCVDPKNYSGDRHERAEEVSSWGVVGARRAKSATWFNHMSARQVLDRVGSEVWECYYKFCTIRNPFDKAVSYFWHDLDSPARDALSHADFSVVREAFTKWTALRRLPIDAFIYTLDGCPAVDEFIRYERLEDDLRRVCTALNLPWQPERLGRYKNESRKRPERFEDYYTPAAAERVARAFAWELDLFQYPALLARNSL
jgi:hypothetical protein